MQSEIVQNGKRTFDSIVGLLDYPMFIVTTRFGDERAGCLVGFASQVSIDPARFLVALSTTNHTYRTAARGATHLAVHLLRRGQIDLARLFGGEAGDRVDKFARCATGDGPEGLPILFAAPAWFVGRILNRFDLGDHVGHLIAPVSGWVAPESTDVLTYADVEDLEPGHQA